MRNLLSKGLTDAWRNLYPALRLFWPVAALTVVYLAPYVFSLAYMMLIPFRTQQVTGIAIACSIVEYAISMFCFLWGLSILSKTYATVAPGKLACEGAS